MMLGKHMSMTMMLVHIVISETGQECIVNGGSTSSAKTPQPILAKLFSEG